MSNLNSVEAMTVEEAERVISKAVDAPIESSRMKVDPDAFRYAYRAAAMRLHPDTGTGGDAWHQLQRAAEILKHHHGIA